MRIAATMYGNASKTWRTRMLRSMTADTARTMTNATAQTAAAMSRFIARTTRGVPVRLTLLLLAAGLSANCATLTPLPQARAAEGMVLTRYFAVAHPSQPNYVAMISGSTAGALTDSPITLDRAHIGNALGTRWRVYAEDYPALTGKCNLIKQSGLYVRRHVPFLSFKDVQQGTCSQVVPFAQLKADKLPDFAMIVPNLKHDGHRPATMKDANDWLNAQIAPLLEDAASTKDTVFIVTFDEDDSMNAQNNRVFTVLWGDHVQHGARADVYDHEDLLATIAALLAVAPPPFDEAGVRPIGGIWK